MAPGSRSSTTSWPAVLRQFGERLTLECADGDSIFETAKERGLVIETACVGKGTCGLCRVKIVSGEEFLNDYGDVEEKHLGNVYYLTKVRLSCQSIVRGGDVVVELAPKKKPRKQR